MTWNEMRQAVNEARATLNAAKRFIDEMADMVAGNLRSGDVSARTLTKLKRELRDWNIHTNTWRPR